MHGDGRVRLGSRLTLGFVLWSAFMLGVVRAQEPGAPQSLPQETLTGRVAGILQEHCARCHDAARENAPLVGNFTRALALEELVAHGDLIAPGVADASLLYNTMLNRHRPMQIFRDGERWVGPDASEIAAVRRWIEGLPAAGVDKRSNQQSQSDLAIRAKSTPYRVGESVQLSVQSSSDCFLTLIGVDFAGQAIVLFPNDLEPDNRLSAGEIRRIPAEDAGYLLRAGPRGRETIIGICSTSERPPLLISHDYEHERFTILGEWESYLTKMLEAEASGRTSEQRTKSRRGRRRAARAAPLLPDETFPREARAVIVFEVH